jgi:hypothetical protein
MKRLINRLFAFLFVILMVSSFGLIIPVKAATYSTTAFLDVNPYPLGVGQQSTITGWIIPAPPSGHYYTVYFKITDPDLLTQVFGPALTDSSGYASIYFTPIKPGSYSVQFYMLTQVLGSDTYFGSSSSGNPPPNIVLIPSSGVAGSSVTVTGNGFASSSLITISYSGTFLVSTTSSSSGSLSATFVVPVSGTGGHTVTASDGVNSATATFTVKTPTIVLSPSFGPKGTSVTVTGTGFKANSAITLQLDGNIQAFSATSDSVGAFSGSFAIPAFVAGAHIVLCSDGTYSATSTFTITVPSIVLSPSNGVAGSSVTVTGSGFLASSTVVLSFGGTILSTVPTPLTTNVAGSFSGQFIIPNSLIGPYAVICTDTSNNVGSATFTVSSPPVITPSAGNGGSINPSTPQTVNYGDSITFSVSANLGYVVTDVLVDGVSVGEVSSYTFNNVQASHTIEAFFAVLTSPIIWVSPNPNSIQNQPITITMEVDPEPPAGEIFANSLELQIKYPDNTVQVTTYSSGTDGRATTTFTPTSLGTYNFAFRYLGNTFGSDTYLPTGTTGQGVTVNAAPTTFTITPSAGSGGSINPNTPQTVNSGVSQSFSIAANAGYHIVDVLVDGSSVGPVTSYTFTNVQADHSISASFAPGPYYLSLFVSSGIGGTVSPSGTTGPYDYGTNIQITATPAMGYTFRYWWSSGLAALPDATTTISMINSPEMGYSTNKIWIAVFDPITFTLTPSAGSGGSISPSTPMTVAYGGSQTFSLSANAGYHIADVLVDGSSVGAVLSYAFSNVQADHTIAAFFALDTSRITINSDPSLSQGFYADGTFYPYEYSFDWVVGSTHTIEASSPLSYATGVQYVWTGWSDGGAISHAITVPDTATFITANYKLQYQVTVAAGTGGVVSPSTTDWYDAGSKMSVLAMANSGYSFESWSSSTPAITFDNPTFQGPQVTVNGYGTVTASFVPIVSLTITNKVIAPPTNPDATNWNYRLGKGVTVLQTFTLPIAGGGSRTFSLPQGTYWIEQDAKYPYDTIANLNGNSIDVSSYNTVFSTTAILGDQTNTVEFTSYPYIANAGGGGGGGGGSSGGSSSVATIYNVPIWRAVPVQSSWDTNFKDPTWTTNLVKDKPMVIMVNLTYALKANNGPVLATDGTNPVKVTIISSDPAVFPTLVANTYGTTLSKDNVTIIATNPPSVLGTYTFTCTVTYNGAQIHTPAETTTVTVKQTSPVSIYYLPLTRAEYGDSSNSVSSMITGTKDFVKSVYPIPGVKTDQNTTVTLGNAASGGDPYNDPKVAMCLDAQLAEQQAKIIFGNYSTTIGVAIGPYTTANKNYFKYHGATAGGLTAVGVSFGKAVKGVVVMDGYYSAVAHEIGHTFGVYYPGTEEYDTYNPGIRASGYSPEQNKWRGGTDFMGLSVKGSTDTIWVDTAASYSPLFSAVKASGDPQIILVNGIIFKDDTMIQGYNWYSMPYGTPDTVPTGRFGIRFTNSTGTYETRFDAQFSMNIDPGIEMGQDIPKDLTGFGSVPTNFAAFAFAAEYPVGTTNIEVVDHSPPGGGNERIIKTISPQDVVPSVSSYFGGFLQPINTDGSSIFKSGSTVPIKFQLKGPEGQFITGANAKLSYTFLSTRISGTELEATSNGAANTGNLFRYDTTSNQYIFNLNTKDMQKGTYQLKITFDDGLFKTVQISLK